MATDTGNGYSPHLRGLTVTTISTLLGMAAGVGAAVVAAGPSDTVGLIILGAAILVQLPLFKTLGIDTDDFSTKDHLYITFMTSVLWFMTWGLILTTNAL
jgi:hypothetical protein